MSQQTSYSVNHQRGYAGLLADIAPREIESKRNEETVAGAMQFGLGVKYGTADDTVLLPSSGSDSIIGFVVYTTNFELATGAENIEIEENASLSILRDGSIYVVPEDDVTQGGAVFVRHTVNTNETIGAVRSDADTDKAVEADWEFAESGAAGSVVKIRKK